MPEQSSRPDKSKKTGRQSKVGVSGGEIKAGRDVEIAGRDIVTVEKGFSAAQVQRLLITVGVTVFVTAACFFSGGLIVGYAALDKLNQPPSGGLSQEAAHSMQTKLEQLNQLSPGESFPLRFTEDEISSYVHFNLGSQIELDDGQVRFLDPGRVVLGGRWAGLNNLPIAATLKFTRGDTPIQVEAAAIQVLQLGNSNFGWVAVPTALVQPLAGKINNLILGKVSVDAVRVDAPNSWIVTVIKR